MNLLEDQKFRITIDTLQKKFNIPEKDLPQLRKLLEELVIYYVNEGK